MTDHRSCARGCTVWDRHLADCEDRDQCRGCQPRQAEHGNLCYGCHKRLADLLSVAGGQVTLLAYMADQAGEQELSALTQAQAPLRWRVDSDQTLRTLYAKPRPAFSESEPYRVGVLDVTREIEDRLGMWVVHLENDYHLSAPEPSVSAQAEWLGRHLERLEHRDTIGPEVAELVDVMSRAHSLAPWREQVARLHGIPCPECHTTTLAMFGGDSDVTCVRCSATMSHERYGIWTRILAEEQTRKGESA